MESIIGELKSVREKFAITMLEISQGCGVTERSVIAWLNNNSKPYAQHLVKIEAFVKRIKAKAKADEKREIERCKALILNEIYNGLDYVFFSRPRPGERYSEGTYPTGVAQKTVSLMSLSKICERILNDSIILEALDNLAEQGLLKVISIFIPRRKLFERLTLELEIAEAIRHIPAQDVAMEIKRVYRDQPLSQEEIKINPGILKPGTTIKKMIEDRESALKAQYGASGIEAEIREHKEKIEDEARLRISQFEVSESLAKINKGAKKMEGDHRPASEFNTLPNERIKVREFYEEVVENNTDRPLVVYDCNQQRVEISPHSKKIVLRIKPIKKMPISKEIKVIK